MNKKWKYLMIGVIIIAIIGLFFLALKIRQDNDSTDNTNLIGYLEEQDMIMDSMMEDMENITATGDPSIDFLYGMIPHHESAIDMAQSFQKYGGSNVKLLEIADSIIETQTKEIEEMNTMITELEATIQSNETKEEEYLKEYNDMFDDTMSHDMNTPKSVDEAFADGMIMHHEMAVDMAETILKYTDNDAIIEMANNIIQVQTQEISEMRAILTSLK